MLDIKSIVYQNLPCWYELSFLKNKDAPAIILKLHKDFIGNLGIDKDKLDKSPIIESLRGQFGFKVFSLDFNEDIGFEKVFKNKGESGEFMQYAVEIPCVKKDSGKCKECNGTGQNEEFGGECIYCFGKGRGYYIEWGEAHSISASFTALFSLLQYWGYKNISTSKLSQLMEVETVTISDSQGGALWGEISIPLKNWIKGAVGIEDEKNLPEMLEAMITTYKKMFPNDFDREYSFRACVRSNGAFTAICPGDACSIQPSDWHMESDKGYKFSYHNVDSPMQQLTFLAGLAALCDMARKDKI